MAIEHEVGAEEAITQPRLVPVKTQTEPVAVVQAVTHTEEAPPQVAAQEPAPVTPQAIEPFAAQEIDPVTEPVAVPEVAQEAAPAAVQEAVPLMGQAAVPTKKAVPTLAHVAMPVAEPVAEPVGTIEPAAEVAPEQPSTRSGVWGVPAPRQEDGLRNTVVWSAPARMSRPQRIAALICGVAVAAIVLVAVLHAGGAATSTTTSRQVIGNSIPSVAASLADVSQTTTPTFSFSSTPQSDLTVAPTFASYYDAHGGVALLGAPITPAYPTTDGVVQFFVGGGLLAKQAATATPSTSQSASIERIPVVSTLLKMGSLVALGDNGSLTYAALRAAAVPDHLQPLPSPSATSGVFIGEGHRGATVIGHTIAQPFYDYISDSTVSPDGWQEDEGLPLTEALHATATVDGSAHTLLVQAFENVVLASDQDADDAIEPVDAGIAYLRTLSPPTVLLNAGTTLWATGDMALTANAGSGAASVHIGQNFALKAAGDGSSQWVNGALWYHVQWSAPKRNGEAWAQASALTLVNPGDDPAMASFDVLSPQLASYLSGYGGNVSAVVFDETRNIYYNYNPTSRFTLASSAKVPIMLTFLTLREHQGVEPNSYEMATLTTMIENSNNNSAQALYELAGEDNGIRSFLMSVGIYDWVSNPDGWGWSSFSPTSMVHLLTLLHDGKVLTPQDRALALNLMNHIEPDQQVGVGDTAPQGATVQMKDGWVPGPDGLWAVNSSGIVTVGSETYEIAVYSQHFGDITTGWDIVNTVSGDVGKALV